MARKRDSLSIFCCKRKCSCHCCSLSTFLSCDLPECVRGEFVLKERRGQKDRIPFLLQVSPSSSFTGRAQQ